jgi:F-type H+-transporting ATPase subunit b
MHIDWWTLGLQTINLVVLVWILSRFLFRPIADIIRRRQATAAELLSQAAAERAQAGEEERAAEQDKQAAEKARGTVLQSAAKEAGAEKAHILDAARQEADRLRAEAKAEIEKLRQTERARNDREAGELALTIAAKLFERLPDGARVDGFIDGLAEAVAKLPEQARTELGAAGEPIPVRAARTLSAAEAKACEGALSKALGRTVRIAAAVDSSLIAGLEIDAPHAAIRNSFRADLARIASELRAHG